MFIISKNKNSEEALKHYQNELVKVSKTEKIYAFNLINGYKLFWTSVKPSDNLHVYNDGYVIGKANFSEELSKEPIIHDSNLPQSYNTLLQSCKIRLEAEDINVYPNEQFNVYYSKNSVSDYQLLIGKSEKIIPDFFNVAVLGAVGYFPGDLTLFKEVRKISYLHSLNFLEFTQKREDKFELKKNNDDLLIDRYKEIVPKNVKTGLSLSGGLDSRFILGILLAENIKPTVYSRSDGEDEIVKKISDKLDLDCYIEKGDSLDEYSYTLCSDARIYYRGGNYNQLKEFYNKDEILHNGLWSDPTIENAFKTAWKKPGLLKTIFEDLIDHALLGNIRKEMFGLNRTVTKEEIKSYLSKELEYQKQYYNFKKRKQWAGWFYHINRGINWSNSTMADASFYIYPVYLLGDKKSVELGLSSSGYSNFYKERLRKINQKLFTKELQIDYSDGRSFHSKLPIVIDFYKIYHEYLYKLVRKFTERRKFLKGYDKEILANINVDEHKDLSKYFINDLKTNLEDPRIAYALKRVMVTLNNTLKFLDN